MTDRLDFREHSPRRLRPQFAPRVHEWLSDNKGAEESSERFTGDVLADAMEARATDIHFESEEEYFGVRFRIDGVLHDVAAIPREPGIRLLGHFKTLARIDPVPLIHPAEGRCDFGIDSSRINLRISVIPCISGEMMAIRILDTRNLRLELSDLGFSQKHLDTVQSWLKGIAGMFVVVGPTGTGKTTTLYALLHELKMLEQSVVTIEDPVEYKIAGINQMQVDVRRNFTFSEGVKAMLRMDPDFMLLGEIRDSVSAHAAVDAAGSGKILLSTLHSRDAAGAITSLRNFGLKDYQTAAALEVVVAQRLARRLCRYCRHEAEPSDSEREWIEAAGFDVPEKIWKPGGCDRCGLTGYSGRTGLFEVWRVTPETSRLILNHGDERRLRQALRESGVDSVLDDAWEKLRTGVISLEELRRSPSRL